jgi:hypothetical protein
MSRGDAPRILTMIAVGTMVASLIGFVITMVLNALVFDEFDAYGEVPVPGSGSVHLPEGEVIISFHTLIIGSGGGLPVPQMSISIAPPEGVPDPVLVEDVGGTTTVNNDARVQVWTAQILAEGDYAITTEGQVSAYVNPTLAFGHGSPYGHLPKIFAIVFGVALVDLIIVIVWIYKRKPRASTVTHHPSPVAALGAYVPTDEGIRIQELDTLVRLRDSGALTQDEFEAEKKRVLGGR